LVGSETLVIAPPRFTLIGQGEKLRVSFHILKILILNFAGMDALP